MNIIDNSNNFNNPDKPNKGILKIEQLEDYSYRVIFEPVDSTVWLHKMELASLFGVTVQKVNSCMHAILKENIIDVKQMCKYDLYVSGNRIRYDVREVRLEVIIAMAFRIGSPPAKIFREWVVRRCLYPGVELLPPLSDPADFCMN